MVSPQEVTYGNLLVGPVLATRRMSEPKLFADANDLPCDRLEEDQVLLVVLANLRVDQVVPDNHLWGRTDMFKVTWVRRCALK